MTRIPVSALLVAFALYSPGAYTEEAPAEVMLFGTFHFASPKQDAVKTDSIDVTTAESQAYLIGLSELIAKDFKPTQVLLEYSVENEELVNTRYRDYLAGEFELPVNEIYQVGFRVAAKSGLETVESFDHREIQWLAGPMLEYAEAHDPDAHAAFHRKIEEITVRMQHEQDTMTLPELLAKQNDPAELANNKALYVATNAIGAADGYSGADASASWWHRNFRMYANIQKAAQPGERVFVLGGSGHIAIIADLLALDEERVAVDVRPLLEPEE